MASTGCRSAQYVSVLRTTRSLPANGCQGRQKLNECSEAHRKRFHHQFNGELYPNNHMMIMILGAAPIPIRPGLWFVPGLLLIIHPTLIKVELVLMVSISGITPQLASTAGDDKSVPRDLSLTKSRCVTTRFLCARSRSHMALRKQPPTGTGLMKHPSAGLLRLYG
jgi:hypothetical protein